MVTPAQLANAGFLTTPNAGSLTLVELSPIADEAEVDCFDGGLDAAKISKMPSL